jgi:hypothetical protein
LEEEEGGCGLEWRGSVARRRFAGGGDENGRVILAQNILLWPRLATQTESSLLKKKPKVPKCHKKIKLPKISLNSWFYNIKIFVIIANKVVF